MGRPPRYYPHTRKEWADIREQFTELYQAEGKKPSEIVDILGERGFHAELVKTSWLRYVAVDVTCLKVNTTTRCT